MILAENILEFQLPQRLKPNRMNAICNNLLVLLVVIALLLSCDSNKTTEIKLEDEGLTLTANVLNDSISLEGIDTIRILHGEYNLNTFSENSDFKTIETVFNKGFIGGKLKITNPDGTYEGKFISEGAKEFYDKQVIEKKVRRKISKFFPDGLESQQNFTRQIRQSNYLVGGIGIPVGKHTIKRGDTTLNEMEYANGYPVGIWKKLSARDTYDFIEFDSGKIVKEYTLQYQNGIVVKRIEDNREFIYENGIEVGTIVKVQFNCRNGGSKLFVPSGKMWTPLYYEVITDDYSYRIPQIYPKKAYRGGGWLKSEAYKFPEKENFTSYKISKQNHRAIYGNGEQAVLVDCHYYAKAEYKVYFFEEAN